jgi:hypothetical protein
MIAEDANGAGKPGNKSLPAIDLLQKLATHRDDFDSYMKLEELKPENRRDTLGVARKLYGAGRNREALNWLLSTPKGMRVVTINGTLAAVGENFQAQEHKLLEADIRDALKERGEAQQIRWTEFLKSFDAKILRVYVSKLPDFTEFEELDKVFATVLGSNKLLEALRFLVEWPRLDLASEHVLKHAGKWRTIPFEAIAEAADALADDYPVAATLLYRSIIDDILARHDSGDYVEAASFYAALTDIAPRLPASLPFEKHEAYLARLNQKYGRRYMFWNLIPAELRFRSQ